MSRLDQLKNLTKPEGAVKKKRLNAEEELTRLLGKVWRNPYDVLDLTANVTEEQIKRKFREFTRVLHPDKCSDPRAPDAFTSK